MLLVVSHSGDETANYLCRKMGAVKFPVVRVDTDTCASEVRISYTTGQPVLHSSGGDVAAADLRHVWLRRPRAVMVPSNGDAAEQTHVANEWSEALEGFLAHVPMDRWMNHPVQNVLASHKLEQLTRAAAHGLPVPKTIVTQSPDALRAFWGATGGHVVAKPLASGFLERADGRHASIYTTRLRRPDLDLREIAACPTLFQEEVAKIFDVRITAIDGRFTAVSMRRDDAAEPDVRRNNMDGVSYGLIDIPPTVDTALREVLASYGLRFAAVDFGVTADGAWTFFEINPNGQWAWLDLVGTTALWEDFVDAFSA